MPKIDPRERFFYPLLTLLSDSYIMTEGEVHAIVKVKNINGKELQCRFVYIDVLLSWSQSY